MAKRKKKKAVISLTPMGELISKVRRGGRPDQVFKNKKKEANRKKCRKKVRHEA
jgi:hypothetical protein